MPLSSRHNLFFQLQSCQRIPWRNPVEPLACSSPVSLSTCSCKSAILRSDSAFCSFCLLPKAILASRRSGQPEPIHVFDLDIVYVPYSIHHYLPKICPPPASYWKALSSGLPPKNVSLYKVCHNLHAYPASWEYGAKVVLIVLRQNMGWMLTRSADYLYKSTLMSNGLSKSFNISCFVSFSERLAWAVGIFQSMPKVSSRMLMPPSASGW